MRGDQFFEPEKSSGMVGWASKQLFLWVIAGLVLYVLVANVGTVLTSPEAAKPIAAPTAPGLASSSGGGYNNSLTLRAGRDGHVYTAVNVNGVPVRMIVDTGATDVALSLQDAAAAGIGVANLAYTGRTSTANGVTRVAPVTLRTVRIGQLEIADVRAAVVEHLDISLLGQSFLSRLDSYEMRDGILTLSWR
jgi:aspartyl protease family protein